MVRQMHLKSAFWSTTLCALVMAAWVRAQDAPVPAGEELGPLAAKEQMIRDRFQRFQDRIYRLSEELSEAEPENAERLARALSRAGELGLADQLDEIMALLNETSELNQAVDAQGQWLADADRLLSILLERDGENDERKEELERLEQYRQALNSLLEQERGLREASAQATDAARLKAQLDQAIARLEAMLQRQGQLGDATAEGQQAEEQERLADDAKELAEELERLSKAAEKDSPPMQQAKEKTKEAGSSTQQGSQSMSKAGQQMQQGSSAEAKQQQAQAEQSLQKAKEQLEAAKKALEETPSAEESAEKQEDVAEQTKQLSEKMQQESQSGGQGKKSKSGQAPGQQNLQQAQKGMKDAAESLEQNKPDDAAPKQDEAINQLEQAKQELEQQLQQLRKEEREETLRDLEARFRDLLARQRPINDSTIELDRVGSDKFTRAEELQLADLVANEIKLAEDAATCVHILDEEGTTIAFPRVVAQIAEDMKTVADRLSAANVGAVTQTIEQEIVSTLEQLLEAVKQMQQENEQSSGQPQDGESGESPLLPKSAELKLLRAGQERINTRTEAIESGVADGTEPSSAAHAGLKKLATRQTECLDIARDMRDRKPPS